MTSLDKMVAELRRDGECRGHVPLPAILNLIHDFYADKAKQEYDEHVRSLTERTREES
jgi:hypothetical protein